MNKSNIDKILNSIDETPRVKTNANFNKPSIDEYSSRQSNNNDYRPQPQLEPTPSYNNTRPVAPRPTPRVVESSVPLEEPMQVKPRREEQPMKNEYREKPTTQIIQPKTDEKIYANGETESEFEKTVQKHFGSGFDADEDENANNGIKIKKNVNSILAEINKRTFIQTMSKDKTQFSKTFNIKVVGIGGAGNNIVKYMKTSQEWPDFVQIIALNTDYVALSAMGDLADIFILGAKELDGNGSGGDPNVGKMAAEADAEIIKDMLKGTDILILTAGLGKGTGTGATPIIAKIAQELGILTIGLFNLPSIGAEGNKTYSNALSGLQKLSYLCNGLTTVNNDKIISLDRERMSIKKAFEGANQYIKTIVEEIINIITKPSDINIDFADVRNFFEDKNGFLFMRIDLTDYTKDAIKESLEHAIKVGFSEININESQKALINFRLNENVPSIILENTRSALKEMVSVNNINIVHGISYNDVFENAQINVLLTGSFELGAIEDEEEGVSNQPNIGTSSIDLNALSDEEEPSFPTPKPNPTPVAETNSFSQPQQKPAGDFYDYYNRPKSTTYSFEDDDDETLDNQRYSNGNPVINRTVPTTNLSRDYEESRPKKKLPWWKRLFGRNKEEY